MATIYSVVMNKGGVGKTTLATNLAAVIRETEPTANVLIIDMDGQGNSALAYGHVPASYELTMYDVMIGKAALPDILQPLGERLYIAPSNNDMSFIEMDILTDLNAHPNPLGILREKIKPVADMFDYIVIDTPPSLGLVSANVLNIDHNRILIPFSPESFSVQGLIRIAHAVSDFKVVHNPSLRIEGVVGQIIDSRTNLHVELLQEARRYCFESDIPFLETVIPRSIRFANATAYHERPAALVDKHVVAQSYFEIWKELSAVGTPK